MVSIRALTILLVLVAVAKAAEPVVIATGSAPNHPQQPQFVIDDKGAVHLVYGVQSDTFYVRSTDGKSFSSPVKLPSAQVMSLGMRRGPRIAVGKGSICVTVVGGKQGKGKDGDVLAFHSADDGKTWSDAVIVNDVPDAAREGLHGMASGPKGELACIWLDLRNKRTEVMASTSADGGKTWSENILVYRSPGGSVCECCHPSIAFDSKGQIVAMWRNSLNGNRDMYVAVAPAAGNPFGEAAKLGTGEWKLDRCPMDGGALAVAKDGSLLTVWRRDSIVFSASPGQRESQLSQGEQPVVAATSKGAVAAWLTKRGNDLMLQRSGQKAEVVSRNAYDPAVASSPSTMQTGLAWEVREGSKGKIYFQPLSK